MGVLQDELIYCNKVHRHMLLTPLRTAADDLQVGRQARQCFS